MIKLPNRGPTVIFQEMDDEAVLFCTQSEVYFGLNSVGKTIWELLGDGVTRFDKLIALLSQRYPEVEERVLQEDAAEFLEQLHENGLVTAPAADPQQDDAGHG